MYDKIDLMIPALRNRRHVNAGRGIPDCPRVPPSRSGLGESAGDTNEEVNGDRTGMGKDSWIFCLKKPMDFVSLYIPAGGCRGGSTPAV